MKSLRMALCLLSVLSAYALATPALAETSTELRAKAERYRNSIPNKSSVLETTDTRISAYEVKKSDAQEQLNKAREDLAEAKSNHTKAKADTSEDAARKLDLATRRLELAERSMQSREKRLERAVTKHADLVAEKEKLQNEIKWMQGQIPALLAKADDLETREIYEAKRKKAAKLAAMAPPPPVATPEPTSAPTPEPTPEPIEIETADGNSFVLPATANDPEGASNSRQAYARGEMQKLLELTRGADITDNRRRDELVLKLNGSELEELEYLGAQQYYTEVPLPAGKHKLAVASRKFVATIPESADGDIFVVIFDVTESRSGRVAFFNKKHLE